MNLQMPRSQAAPGYRIYDGFDPALREPADGQRRPERPPLSWPWRALLAAALAVPLLLLALAAWQNYRLEQREAEARVDRTVGELHEQSLKVFETYELVLAWVDDRIRGLDWQRIAGDEDLHRFLADLQALPEIERIAIIGPDGRLRASGGRFPVAPTDLSGADYFVRQRTRNAGIVIDRVRSASVATPPQFVISRRRSGGGNAAGFDGVLAITAKTRYFADFYSTIAEVPGYSVALLREDGTVLAGYPATPADFAPASPLMRAIARAPTGGAFRAVDGGARLYVYRHVAGLPLYVVFGIPQSAVLADWRRNLLAYSLFAVPSALALFVLMLFAARQLQQQEIATWRWRTTAQRLRREFDRRTQVEAELRQAQKMEALGLLTGGVAHDFNNLLTVLQGNLELLRDRQRDAGLEAKVDQALQTIDRGAKLTRQLLAFARRQPLWTERVDVNALLRRMDELLAHTVGGGVRVETEFAADLWPATADANQLELAVLNLAINARDAMPKGGVLRLGTFNARLSAAATGEEDGDFVAVEVADTGVGMTPEVRARAFEPFFTTKDPDKGTGLGLSMVYGFVRQSGGIATIDSEPGRGTRVRLHLPRSSDATGLPPDRPA